MKRLGEILIPLLTVLCGVVALALVLPRHLRGGEAFSSRPAGGSVVAFGRDVTVAMPVRGDVEVLGGKAIISAPVEGDVVVLGGDVELLAGAIVTGDVIAAGGVVRQAAGSRVSGRVVQPGRGIAAGVQTSLSPSDVERHPLSFFTIALKSSLVLLWLLVAVIVTLWRGREVRSSSVELRVSLFHTLLLGLVAFSSFVVTALLFSYLAGFFVGIPLLILLGLLALMTKAYGMVAVFHAIGTIAIGSRARAQSGRAGWRRGDLAMVVSGVLILGAIRLIPVAGTIIWAIASIVAVGAALGTRFGRREPWFLAWHPLPATDS